MNGQAIRFAILSGALLYGNGDERIVAPGIGDDYALSQPRGAVLHHDLVHVAPGAEQAHFPVVHGAHDDVAGLRVEHAVLVLEDLGRADDVAVDVRLVDVHLADRAHAVLQHAAALAEPDADAPALLVLRARDDLVEALLREEQRPTLELV